MGRSRSVLVAAAVVTLAVAAVVDAFVGSAPPPEPTAAPRPPATTEEALPAGDPFLRAEGVDGRLLYIDDGCQIRTLALPSLVRREAPGRRACSFTTSPGGVPGADGAVVHPRWREAPYAAACERGRVTLHTLSGGRGYAGPLLGPAVATWDGCSPAWRPDGRLGLVRGGGVVLVSLRGARGPGEGVLDRRDVERAFTVAPWNFASAEVAEAAWMAPDLLATVVRGPDGDVLALFRGRRLVGSTPSPYDRLSGLRVSPRGTYVAARIGDAPALVLLDREGEFIPTGLRGHAIAWSLDDAWSALAASDAIYVFEAGSRASRFARIEVAARDVLWP